MTTVDQIREHYDGLSGLYAALWGDHIHHGYWTQPQESPRVAQEHMVRQLATEADIAAGSRVVDLGCGIGGSACWLATHLDCSVLGITLSPIQVEMATGRARRLGLENRVRFEVGDLNCSQIDQRFDIAWILESSEHIIDKKQFIRSVADALRPGGTLVIGAWLAGEAPRNAVKERLIGRVCDGMLCPGLGTMSNYAEWMLNAGLQVRMMRDVTQNVKKTWNLCAEVVKRPQIQTLLKFIDERSRRFAETFPDMIEAYETGAMRYGLLIADRPR
jgi:tocopherol O-methyltransferase